LTLTTYLYVASGDGAIAGVQKWDGNSWSPVGSGPTYPENVTSLVLDTAGNIYAGKLSTDNAVEKWDGSTWTMVGSSPPDYVYALAYASNSNILYAGSILGSGNGSVYQYTSGTWTTPGGTSPSSVSALIFDTAGNLYAGSNTGSNDVQKWNGSTWTIVGTNTPADVDAFTFDNLGNLYAASLFSTNAVWEYNSLSDSWANLGGNSGPNSVTGLVADNFGNLYTGNNNTDQVNMQKWNGSTWSDIGTNPPDVVAAVIMGTQLTLSN
jgi:trimeric autotransporter adhesin